MPSKKSGVPKSFSGKTGNSGPAKTGGRPGEPDKKYGKAARVAQADKKFGKSARVAAELGGKKPSAWREVEQRRPLVSVLDTADQVTGSLEVVVTKTVEASASEIFRAFNDPTRRGWSTIPNFVVRTAVAPRFLRIAMPDGTEVSVAINRKGNVRSTIEVQHARLLDAPAVDKAREQWRMSLGRLAEMLDAF